MPTSALQTLLDLRRDGERRAERALALALGAHGRAISDGARLAAHATAAHGKVAGQKAAERQATGIESAVDAQTRRRFLARLRADAARADAALAAHRRDALGPAERALEAARAEHSRARQRREVVERAIARRRAAHRVEQERRTEAAADDLALRRR